MPTAVQEETNLFEQVSEWSRLEGWESRREDTRTGLGDSPDAAFPALVIEPKPEEKIYIEPRGHKKDGSAVFEMYAWPTLVRVRLLQRPAQEGWEIFTDAGIPFHHDWNRQTFVRLANDMLAL